MQGSVLSSDCGWSSNLRAIKNNKETWCEWQLLGRWRKTPFTFALCLYFTATLISPVFSQVNILTGRADISRDGTNTSETYLTPSNVNTRQFGKLLTFNVDGYVVAQPLYVSNLSIPGQGVHNVVFVATQHDSVYALDADTLTLLWHETFINSAAGVTTVPVADQGCAKVTGYTEIGVMGTPVIDLATNSLFVVAKTKEVSGNTTNYVYRLHSLDITTGLDNVAPVVISAAFQGPGGTVNFSSLPEMQRPALLLSNGTVYIAFGSNGCDITALGWVLAYNESLQQVGVFNTSPGQAWGASVWQSGSGLGGDADGNVYFSTANGIFDQNTGGADFGDTVLKLALNGTGLNWVDYFTPFDQQNMALNDLDLGSGGVTLLPDQPPPSPAHLLIAAGKTGSIYLIDRDNMGRFDTTGNQIVQTIPDALIEYYGNANFWNNLVYFAPPGDTAIKAYLFSSGLLSQAPVAQSISLTPEGLPFISANGNSNGVFWLVRNVAGNILSAFDATYLTQIYNSSVNGSRDSLGASAHFASPVVANGKVYVGTQTQLAVYGLLPVLATKAGNRQTGPVGSTLPLALKISATSPYSNQPIGGLAITFSDGGKGGTFSNPNTTTNSQGVALTNYTLPTVTGQISITATNQGSTTASFTETAVAGTPTTIAVFSGANQTGTVGTVLLAPLVFVVQDQYGNGVPGVSVTFADGSAGGQFSTNPVTTDSSGHASVSYTLPTIAKYITITASTGPLTPASLKVRAVAGPPAVVAVVSGNNQSAPPNTQLPNPLVVAVKDQYGNPEQGLTVTFSDNGAQGKFSTTTPTTGNNGQASVTYTTPSQPGTVQISATVSGVRAARFTETVQ